jgi:hypothetical protein
MEKVHSMRRNGLSRLTSSASLLAALCCVVGCGEPTKVKNPANSLPPQNESSAFVSADLGSIEMINPKSGGPEADPVVAKVLAAGTNATPFLIEKLLDGAPSRVGDLFQYRIGDIAHRLLCDIYHQDFLWPIANVTPSGGTTQLTWQDYLAFVEAPGGRRKLQRMWKDRIDESK